MQMPMQQVDIDAIVHMGAKTELCDIMNIFGADKATRHNYSVLYHHLLKHLRNQHPYVFELGLGSCNPEYFHTTCTPYASAYAWREYFPFGRIYGADIDETLAGTQDRMYTFHVDQTNVNSIRNMWAQPSVYNVQFDVIIDDGYHDYNANTTFLSNSFQKLKHGGWYIIEDLAPETFARFEQDQHTIYRELFNPQLFQLCRLQHRNETFDNNMLIIKK